MVDSLSADFRSAARSLTLRPGYAFTVLAILALTIGATTAAFSIVNGAILKPIPYDEPDQLVEFSNTEAFGRSDVLNVDAFEHLRNVNQSFESVALMASAIPLPLASAETQPVFVSADFFSELLRVDPALGRHFTAADDEPGAAPVVMISHAYWREQMGADPDVIGRAIPHPEYGQLVVTGVLPQSFRSPVDLEDPAPLWAPIGSAMITPDRSFPAIGRLRAGVTMDEARAEFSTILPGVIEAGGVWTSGRELRLDPLANRYTSANERGTIYLFFGAVVALLLVGIANLAGLELARLPQFENELSVRSAMGASGWSLARLMVVRTLALGLTGGILGAWVAIIGTSAFARTQPSYIPRPFDIGADRNVWMFAIGVSIVSSVLIALVPAIRASKRNPGEALQRVTRSATEDRKHRLLQDGLSSVQIAMTVTLLVVGGIALHSFWRMATVDWGFDPEGVVIMRIRLSSDEGPSRIDEFRDALRTVTAGNAVAQTFPAFTLSSALIRAPGADPIPPNVPTGGRWYDDLVDAGYRMFARNTVSSEYFDLLGIPIVEGRPFTEAETRDEAPVAIVSVSLARTLWPGRSPIGELIEYRVGDVPAVPHYIVGVVGDVREQVRDQEMRQSVYLPSTNVEQRPMGTQVIARSSLDSRRIEEAILAVDPRARVNVVWMTDRLAVQIDRDRFYGLVLGSFSAIALILAAMGVYSIISYSVDRRVREIGVRMALGAQSGRVFFETIRRVGLPAAIGLVLGVGGAWIVQPILENYLYSIEPVDSIAYAYVLPVLVAAVIVAGAFPSARASRLNPLEALRYE